MENAGKTRVVKDPKEKSILVSRVFHASLPEVWHAYTESNLLDQWWGPSPWHCETKKLNFSEGGQWIYAMVGPENEKQWAQMRYKTIDYPRSIVVEDSFSDENGNINDDLPIARGEIKFSESNNGTLVEFKMIYPTEEDMNKIIDMGFEQGITICYNQLEELFITHKIPA
jgi:uncharacterized protein YndB with AHSA1/START domain